MSLQDAVFEVAGVLRDAQGLFGPAPASVGLDTPMLPDAPAPAWNGEGANTHSDASRDQRAGVAAVGSADASNTATTTAAAGAASEGRAGMGQIIGSAQSSVAALPANTAAGQVALIETLRTHLHRTKALIGASERRNRRLAASMRGYHPPGGSMGGAPAGGSSMGGAQPGGGGGHGRRPLHRRAHTHKATAIADTALKPTGNASKDQMQAYAASQLAKHGWGAREMLALVPLWDHESSWSPSAHNPSGASGIAQFMPYTQPYYAHGNEHQPWWAQIDQGLQYLADRYGSPSAAWAQYFNHAGGEGSY